MIVVISFPLELTITGVFLAHIIPQDHNMDHTIPQDQNMDHIIPQDHNMDQSDWMSQLPEEFHTQPLIKLAIPGESG